MKFFSRCTCISILLFASMLLVLMPVIKFIIEPESNVTPMLDGFNKVDLFNNRLNQLQSNLLSLSTLIGEDVSLKYVGNEDLFVYFQAVLAPRRIGPDIDSNYLLIHSMPGESMKIIADDHNASLVALFTNDLGLFLASDHK